MTMDNRTQTSDPFAYLYPHQFMVLTTFRKNGDAVPTTVWFAPDNGRLYVTTSTSTGKIKRIRNNSHVLLAPSDRVGNVQGQQISAQAREVSEVEHDHAHAVLAAKYGQQFLAMAGGGRGTASNAKRTYIEIAPEQ